MVGLQLGDWSKSSVISSNEGVTRVACLADPKLPISGWGCQMPLPGASPAAQLPLCQPSLLPLQSAELTDEVGV